MMWSIYLLLFGFLVLKEKFFFFDFFFLEFDSIFLIFMSLFCFFVCFSLVYNFSNSKELIFLHVISVIFFISILGFFCSLNFFMMLLCIELSSGCMMFLILRLSAGSDMISSTLFMMVINMGASTLLMWFCVNYPMSFIDSSVCNLISSKVYTMFGVLLLFSKIPMLFMHPWLTKAHVASSGFCSMILASIMLKLGTFGLFKVMNFIECSYFIWSILLSFGLIGSLILCLIMVRCTDLKFLVAVSSIMHMSFVGPFLLIYSNSSVLYCMEMMVGHGLASCLLFFIVALFYENSHSRSSVLNSSLESLSPFYALFTFFFIFFNLGLPPFISFFSEVFCCVSLFLNSLLLLYCFFVLMLSSIFFTLFVCVKSLQEKNIFSISFFCNSKFFYVFLSCFLWIFLSPFFYN